jgi:hypothetical protein
VSDASSGSREAECDAYRAAGQAHAAAMLGLPIKRVSVRGIVFDWPANQPASWDQQRSEVAMGLTGIAAVGRFRFGTAPPGGGTGPFNLDVMTEQQLDDWDTVQTTAVEIDPRNEHRVMADAWTLATELVTDNDSWDAIKWLAGIIEGVELDGVAVTHIVEGDRAAVMPDRNDDARHNG